MILALYFKFVSLELNLITTKIISAKSITINTFGVSQGHAYFAKSMPPLGILTSLRTK
jgi:hypothetical protein